MSGLAQLLTAKGHTVNGSDRKTNFELKNKLLDLGINIFVQDGSGVSDNLNRVIVSRAIEDDNPDLVRAKEKNISIVYRQDVLKELFNENPGIAVAGTNGKTTVTGMIGTIFNYIDKKRRRKCFTKAYSGKPAFCYQCSP